MAAAVDIHAAGGALDITLTAEWDLSTHQYRIVHIGGVNRNVVVASQAGIKTIGVLQNKPSSGRAARVRVSGETKLVAGAAITRNDNLDTGATGYARTAVGSNILAIALETVVASGTFSALLVTQVAL